MTCVYLGTYDVCIPTYPIPCTHPPTTPIILTPTGAPQALRGHDRLQETGGADPARRLITGGGEQQPGAAAAAAAAGGEGVVAAVAAGGSVGRCGGGGDVWWCTFFLSFFRCCGMDLSLHRSQPPQCIAQGGKSGWGMGGGGGGGGGGNGAGESGEDLGLFPSVMCTPQVREGGCNL